MLSVGRSSQKDQGKLLETALHCPAAVRQDDHPMTCKDMLGSPPIYKSLISHLEGVPQLQESGTSESSDLTMGFGKPPQDGSSKWASHLWIFFLQQVLQEEAARQRSQVQPSVAKAVKVVL